MFRCLPPAGHRISFTEICRSFSQNPNIDLFFQNLGINVPYFLVSSGTAALCLGLQAIGHGSSRKQVILPAYTCPSLLAAVIKARLEPVLCDLKPNTFQVDPEQLSAKLGEETLGIIAVHLFGLPENIVEIKKRVQGKHIAIVEDAAQAFGNSFASDMISKLSRSAVSATPHEIMLGSMGDIGIASFGRGKPLSLLGGGAVLVNNSDLREQIKTMHDLIDGPVTVFPRLSYVAKLIVYSILFHPSLFWIPANIPGLRIGETHFSLDFVIEKNNQFMVSIGNIIAARLDEIRQTRLYVARIYRESLDRFREDFAYMPECDDNDDHIALLRFPLIFKKKERRDSVLGKLRAAGLGATGMYPAPLNEISGTKSYLPDNEVFPEAKSISERILTLPIHEYVNARDIQKIKKVFEHQRVS
jgi:perosamine synthetase